MVHPELHHIGFKIITTLWFLRSAQHMYFIEDYKRQKWQLLKAQVVKPKLN